MKNPPASEQHPLEMMLLNTIFDAGGAMPIEAVRQALPAGGIEIRKAITRQGQLGNLRRHVEGEPLTLTASARDAIAAGRAHRPMMLVDLPSRHMGKTVAGVFAEIARRVTIEGGLAS